VAAILVAARLSAATLTPQIQAFSEHWTKLCQRQQTKNSYQICIVGETRRVGATNFSAMLIEAASTAKKILRLTLPLGMDLRRGATVSIDHKWPINAPYSMCVVSGCVADFQVSSDLVEALKHGEYLHVQSIDGQGRVVSLDFPLVDFGAAYDGAPNDRQ
jgi:invasion protein IalB